MNARPNNAYGSPLWKKLGINPGNRVAFPSAPDGFLGLLGELPEGVTVKSRASGPLDVETDLTGNVTRELGLANRLVDNKVCAIDETWSGLRFVIRLEDR